MRKTVLILVVLLLTTPLYAGTITFTATDNGDGSCTISYDCGTDPAPVAMGLDVDVDGAVKLTGYAVDSFFDIYMDAAHDLGGSYGYGDGTPIALQGEAGETDLTTNGDAFCLSMGGLGGAAEPLDPAPTSGSFTLSGPTCTGTISASELRTGVGGTGVVDVEGNAMTVVGLPLAFTIGGDPGCTYTGPDVGEWNSLGQPQSWCADRQCHGDADDTKNQFGPPYNPSYAWVSTEDVQVLVEGFRHDPPYSGDPIADPWIAADFDHQSNQYGPPYNPSYARVSTEDVAVLVYNFRDANGEPLADCQTASPTSP